MYRDTVPHGAGRLGLIWAPPGRTCSLELRRAKERLELAEGRGSYGVNGVMGHDDEHQQAPDRPMMMKTYIISDSARLLPTARAGGMTSLVERVAYVRTPFAVCLHCSRGAPPRPLDTRMYSVGNGGSRNDTEFHHQGEGRELTRSVVHGPSCMPAPFAGWLILLYTSELGLFPTVVTDLVSVTRNLSISLSLFVLKNARRTAEIIFKNQRRNGDKSAK